MPGKTGKKGVVRRCAVSAIAVAAAVSAPFGVGPGASARANDGTTAPPAPPIPAAVPVPISVGTFPLPSAAPALVPATPAPALVRTSAPQQNGEAPKEVTTGGTTFRLYPIRYASPTQLLTMLKEAVPEITVIAAPDSYLPASPGFNPLTGRAGGFDGASRQDIGGLEQLAGGVSKRSLGLLLKGTPAIIAQALDVLALVDTPPLQMNIDILVVESSPDTNERIGLSYQWNPLQYTERPPKAGSGGSVSNLPGPLTIGSYGRSAFNPIATLNAQITQNKATILANPNISVMNDQTAWVFLGDSLRFQTVVASNPVTGIQYDVKEVPVGIILLVHPRANFDGSVTLRVHPVVSTITDFTAGGIPQTASREAETTIRVVSGDTLVIAGLTREETTRREIRVPFLSKLPLVGGLFRDSLKTARRSEVRIFLKVTIRDPEARENITETPADILKK